MPWADFLTLYHYLTDAHKSEPEPKRNNILSMSKEQLVKYTEQMRAKS